MSTEPPPSSLLQKYRKRLWIGLGVAAILRIVLMALPITFWLDLNTFMAWSLRLATVPISGFYAPGYFCDYPPGYLYVLALIGRFFHGLDPSHAHLGALAFMLKLPGAVADILASYLIFKMLRGRVAIRSAYHGALFYAFNPLVILDSCIWGQIDGLLTFLLLGVTGLLLINRTVTAATLAAFSVMLKPQGIFIAPFFVLSQWFRRPWWVWPASLAAGIIVAWCLTLPFHAGGNFLIDPFVFLFQKMASTATTYSSSTINAFNVWAPTCLENGLLMWGERYGDSRTIFGLSHATLGLLFVGILSTWIGVFLYRKRHAGVGPLFLAAALLFLGLFLFSTRMHERYIFPAIAFLVLASSTNRSLSLNLWAFTTTATLNVAYVMLYYGNQAAFNAIPPQLRWFVVMACVFANMWFFGDLLSHTFASRSDEKPRSRKPLHQILLSPMPSLPTQLWETRDKLWLVGIVGGYFALGLWRLGLPNEQIFDEVYHARTANEYLQGISPYEWTHPPLAKLLIAVGIKAFGLNGFGWRIVSLMVGALTLGIFYSLARRMFDTRRPALIATLLLACDGVFFVQSRVAMTNIYVLCFLLAATWAAWVFMQSRKERYLPLAALALGAALATRWSAIYAWGLVGLAIALYVWFWENPRRNPSAILSLALRCLLYFTLIPVAVYLLSYVPYMAQGHSLLEVVQMQKNMWGYHANLHASHSYSSPWWQWPLMIRPTWYYYHSGKEGVSGILALGNPTLWWASMPALAGMMVVAWRQKLWMGWFVVLLGLGMYLPWAVQPRSLLFMHYMLETLPFAALALAYFLERLWRHPDWESPASTYLLLSVGLFLFFYPLLSALPIPEAFYRMHIWFSTWI